MELGNGVVNPRKKFWGSEKEAHFPKIICLYLPKCSKIIHFELFETIGIYSNKLKSKIWFLIIPGFP